MFNKITVIVFEILKISQVGVKIASFNFKWIKA